MHKTFLALVGVLCALVVAPSVLPGIAGQSSDVARTLFSQAQDFRQEGKHAEAAVAYQGACDGDHGQACDTLGVMYRDGAGVVTDRSRAETLFRRALAIWETALGPEHPQVGLSLNNLAELYRDQGNYAEAEPLYQRALAIFENTLGPEHLQVGLGMNNLALLYHAQGNHAEAQPLYQRSLTILEKTLGPEHLNVATALENYAALLREMDQETEVAEMEARATAIRAKLSGENPTN